MKVIFSSNLYKRSHWKEPKGFGVWLFEADFGDTTVELQTPHAMSYADAKKNICAQAKALAQANNYKGDVYAAAAP